MSAMEALICEVQRRNVLWNKKNPRYKDRLIVDKEWDAVAHNTGFSKEEAKRKWRNLRDQFAKELKKIRKPHSGDAPDEDLYTGKWQYFVNLEFLRGIVAPRSTEGNVFSIEMLEESQISLVGNEDIDDEDPSDENATPNVGSSSQVSVTADVSQVIATADVPHVIANDGVSHVNANSGGESTNMPSSSNITPYRSKRKRIREEHMDVEEKLLNIEARKLALLETPEDENSLFLRSLLPYLKKMDPLQQLRVRSKFQEILIQEMSPPSTSFHPRNTYFPDHPSTSVSSVPSSAYLNISSPASPADSVYSATNFNNMYPNSDRM